MIDTKRFREINTFQDIKLEKAKLRYEMLMAENEFNDNLNGLQDTFSLSAIVSRLTEGYSVARNVFSRVSGIYNWFSRSGKSDM